MTPGPLYRNSARWHAPEPRPEPLWLSVVVLVAGLVGLWLLITVALWTVPA